MVSTRAEQAGDGFTRVLRDAGVNAMAMPTISIGPPQNPRPLAEALARLASTRWIVFTSAEAVAATCGHAAWADAWRSLPERPRIAAVGPATAARVRAFGLPCDLVPERSSGRGLAAALATCDGSLAGAHVLWPRSDIAGRELPEALTAAGAVVIEPEAYRTSTVQPNALGTFTAMLEAGSVEAVAFFSPSAVTGLARALDQNSGGALARLAGRTEVASIGPSTSAALEALGAPVTIEAETRTGLGARDRHPAEAREARGRGVSFPVHRPRRLRRSDALRGLVRETRLSPQQLIAPLFVCEGEGVRREIGSMPGCFHLSVDALVEECRTLAGLGVAGVILFGIPDAKHPDGRAASDPAGPVARGLAAVRAAVPALSLWADVCLCEYTDHGHCGPIATAADGLVEVDNDATLPLLAAAGVVYANAGADVVAPSDMMDGRVGVIRSALDAAGRTDVVIVSYAAKYASGFYGPFREAAGSAPSFGDRRGYQMDPGNALEALREVGGRSRRGRRHRDGEAGTRIPRHRLARERAFRRAGGRVQRIGRVCDGEGRWRAGLARRAARHAGVAALHPARGRRHHPDLLRERGCAVARVDTTAR